MAKDIIGRDINVGDFVAFYNNVYQVESIPVTAIKNCRIKVILVKKSKTTKAQHKPSAEMCLIPNDDILFWLLKKGLT